MNNTELRNNLSKAAFLKEILVIESTFLTIALLIYLVFTLACCVTEFCFSWKIFVCEEPEHVTADLFSI